VALIQRVAVGVGVAWCSRGCCGGLSLVLLLAWLGVRGGCGRGPWRRRVWLTVRVLGV
jgi:hypothetical protein